ASGVTIPAGGYGFADALVSYVLGQQRRVSGTLSLQRGEFYDGTMTAIGYTGGRVSVTHHLSVDPAISINRVRLPAGNFTARLLRARTDYVFTPWMFVTALLQYNSSDRSVSSNFRVRW